MPLPVQPWGCKGRSPLHKKTKNLPLPRRGRGVGGMGAENQTKGGVGRRPARQAPVRHRNGWSSRQRRGYAPAGCLLRRFNLCRAPPSPRDARGEAPCIRKLKISPFPPGRALCERGSGGWGQKIYDMAGKTGEAGHSPPAGTGLAGATGGKEGKPPAVAGTARSAGDQPGTPPLGTCLAGSLSAASGLMPGMQGAKPLA